jgi:hypothetical protein
VRISGLAVPAANSVRSASGHYRPVRKPPLTAATAQMCNLPDPLWGSRASALTAGSQPTRCPSPNTAKPTSDVRHRPQPAPGVPAQPPCQKASPQPRTCPRSSPHVAESRVRFMPRNRSRVTGNHPAVSEMREPCRKVLAPPLPRGIETFTHGDSHRLRHRLAREPRQAACECVGVRRLDALRQRRPHCLDTLFSERAR